MSGSICAVGASVRFTLIAQVAALPETPVSNAASGQFEKP